MLEIGIEVRDPRPARRHALGRRAPDAGDRPRRVLRRASVLILDEPTSALGVKEAAIVLRHVIRARSRASAVIFITHNVQHALPVGDRFTILSHGRLAGEFTRGEVGLDQLLRLMGGGEELADLARELEELIGSDPAAGTNTSPAT